MRRLFLNYLLTILITVLKKRSDVLDELAVSTRKTFICSSLLTLAAMSQPEQIKVIEKIIEELKEKEKKQAEEAAKQEYIANAAANANTLQGNTQNFTLNTDKSWYSLQHNHKKRW